MLKSFGFIEFNIKPDYIQYLQKRINAFQILFYFKIPNAKFIKSNGFLQKIYSIKNLGESNTKKFKVFRILPLLSVP